MKKLTPDNAFLSSAEESVLAWLESLNDEWSVAHNVKIFRANSTHLCEIDLLLIHPTFGIFLGEIKGGTRFSPSDSLRQANRCAALFKKFCVRRWQKTSFQGKIHTFVCCPDKNRSHGSSKIDPLRCVCSEDMQQNAESFFLKMLLRRRVSLDYNSMLALLSGDPKELTLLPKEKRSLREWVKEWLLRVSTRFFRKRKEAELCFPLMKEGRPVSSKSAKKKKASMPPISVLMEERETPERIERLKALLASGESPNCQRKFEASPLSKAIKRGEKESAEILFRAGARVTPYFRQRVTKAFALFNDDLLAEMITADVFSEPPELLPTLFSIASINGFVKTYEAMLRKHPKSLLLKMRIVTGNNPDMSLVHATAHRGNVLQLRILEKNGFPLDELDSEGRTPLEVAEKFNNPECVLFLRSCINERRTGDSE